MKSKKGYKHASIASGVYETLMEDPDAKRWIYAKRQVGEERYLIDFDRAAQLTGLSREWLAWLSLEGRIDCLNIDGYYMYSQKGLTDFVRKEHHGKR